MKVRQNLYIDRDLSNALDGLVIRRGGNKSRIVNEALKTFLARGAGKEIDDLLKPRLAVGNARFERFIAQLGRQIAGGKRTLGPDVDGEMP